MQLGKGTHIASEGYGISVAAKVAGMRVRTVQRWIDGDLIQPSIATSTGRGSWNVFSFDDLVATRTVAKLRRNHVSLQKVKKAVAFLRHEDASVNLSNICLVSDGRDIYERSGKQVRSLLKRPGQRVFTWVVDLREVEEEVRELLRAA